MTTYKQITEKYANAVKERNNAITLAQCKVDRAKARLDYLRQEREQYRQPYGHYSADNARMWNTYSAKIYRAEDALKESEIEFASLSLGVKGAE